MYGLVNKALQEMVEKQFDPTVWARIRADAGVDDDVFISLDAYPDEITYRLVGAVAAVTQQEPTAILHDFGRHWVLDTASKHYGHLLQASGRTFSQFLQALPNFHTRVSLMMPRLIPPEFACDDIEPQRMILHYRSTRAGLVPFVDGLIHGLADLYAVAVTVNVLPERSEGPGHTAFEVAWLDKVSS